MKLYRKCTVAELEFTRKTNRAGGVVRQLPINGRNKPSEEEVVEQVGNNEGAGGNFGFKQDQQVLSQQDWEQRIAGRTVIEFSSGKLFSGTGEWLAVDMDEKYLTKGSNLPTEQGWVAYIGAELTFQDEELMTPIEEVDEEKEENTTPL
ncbi:hypothetical protein BCU61_010390 [Vibrio splendidus]|uniref:hypothetical protein n=1 Tax=Vibrio TaxID=662 RepID=UPI0009774DBE|nr:MULTISPECIES: hypothetical protein [Vibrio]OMO28678.1 hypothetical protein BH583_00940 [Vibrio lentus]PMH66867.1 hypothetical protein BCU61_03810 [Vibrio splendidus]